MVVTCRCNLKNLDVLFTAGLRLVTYQRWSPRGRPWLPRGHILKSLALASRPQVLENWPVLGSRTALFFELLKFCGVLEKFFRKRFFVEIALKIFVKTLFLFFGKHLRLCPWSRAFLSLASDFFCVLGLGLEPCVLDSTSVTYNNKFSHCCRIISAREKAK